MLHFKYSFLLITYFVLGVRSAVVPLTPCKGTDSTCILKAVNGILPYLINGDPELGISPGEPIEIDSYTAEVDKLSLTVSNVKVYGLSKTELISIERDLGKSTITVTMETPILCKSDYVVNGEILSLPITGNGDLELSSDKIRIITTCKMIPFEKNGKKYYKLESNGFKYEMIKKFHLILNNLFGGDKEKAEPVLNLINESMDSIFDDIGKPVIEILINKIINDHINKVLENAPAEEWEIA